MGIEEMTVMTVDQITEETISDRTKGTEIEV